MKSEITPGQAADYGGFDLVMAANLPTPSVLLADREHDADSISASNVLPVSQCTSPARSMSASMALSVAYCLHNLVERCFNKLKNARRVATRYDKTTVSFFYFIDIISIRLWIRHLST